MGRMERRMYKRRRQRRYRWLTVLILGVVVVAVAALRQGYPTLVAQALPEPTSTPITAYYDQTIQSREVVLEEEVWYAIQTGVFSSAEAAQAKANAYADRGAPGIVIADGAKWRVLIASYGTHADAAAVRQRLGENQRVETYLYTWTCPRLHLRLSGMSGQLDVVEAGLTLLTQGARCLRDTATKLDAGEFTAGEASEAVTVLDGQISLWASTARERFAQPYPALVSALLAQTDSWTSRCRALESAAGESATALSAALKCHGMAMFDSVCALRREIDRGE